MRPERLEMQGFAPFRERIAVDFSGLELFVLTGPTGAGKSSVIDAITFALYGSVARYGRRSVGPVISLGAAEARVIFEFCVEGVSYTAARVVRRTSTGGATTAEARLESEGAVLASGAAEVTQAVEALLGLGIDHFTRSVVLPQGEFAAFLHDTPAGQQDLVKALLDIGVLDPVRRLATERARTAQAVAEHAQVRLDQLEDATPAAERVASQRRQALERLVDPVRSAEVVISEGEATVEQRKKEVQELEKQRSLLASVSVPHGVTELAERLTSLQAELSEAQQECASAEEARHEVVAGAEEIPALATLDAAADLEKRLSEAITRRDGVDLPGLEKAREEAHREVEKATESRRRAGEDLEQARNRHAAHVLTAGLSEGDPCPVCDRPLGSDPAAPPADLEECRGRLAAAEEGLVAATQRHRRAETALAEARATHQAAVDLVGELEGRRAKLPHGPELPKLREARLAADRSIEEAERRLKRAREKRTGLEEHSKGLEEATRHAWEAFAAARDGLAALGPPPAEREDLARAWQELHDWSKGRAEELDEKLLQVRATVEEATAAVDKQREELERLLSDAGVAGTGTASARLAGAVATAGAELERIRERRAERAKLEEDQEQSRQKAQIATTLGQHLRADRFEGWLLSEALGTLVDGANGLLADLTAGAYSLALDERTVEVVDHRNADEHRSVRSLSGGETFLVSLALALSLGEQLINLSHRGGARLEAIFLDEGFGTLDAETLETVTVVVSELAAQGRTVGLVTHVKELAEQIPVRFEVKAGPSGSSIEKVEV